VQLYECIGQTDLTSLDRKATRRRLRFENSNDHYGDKPNDNPSGSEAKRLDQLVKTEEVIRIMAITAWAAKFCTSSICLSVLSIYWTTQSALAEGP